MRGTPIAGRHGGTMSHDAVAERLRYYRRRVELTRGQVAEIVGVPEITYRNWETAGRREAPFGEHRRLIVDALSGKSVDLVVTISDVWPIAETARLLSPLARDLLCSSQVRLGGLMSFTAAPGAQLDATHQLLDYWCAEWRRELPSCTEFNLTGYGEDVREFVTARTSDASA